MAMFHEMIQVTDTHGVCVLAEDDMTEPLPGSIILTEGLHGTAWQRHFKSGKWHSTRGGKPKEWTDILCLRNVWLVLDAEPRG